MRFKILYSDIEDIQGVGGSIAEDVPLLIWLSRVLGIHKRLMEYKDWIKLKQIEKIDYLRSLLEGGDGKNGLVGSVASLDRSVGKLKHRMKMASLAGFVSLMVALGVKKAGYLISILKLFI